MAPSLQLSANDSIEMNCYNSVAQGTVDYKSPNYHRLKDESLTTFIAIFVTNFALIGFVFFLVRAILSIILKLFTAKFSLAACQ